MMQSDPSQAAPDNSGDAEQVSVTITAVGDGTFAVTMNEGGADEDGTSDSDDGPQTADNIDDALKMAGQMLGAEADEESQEGGDDNATMSPADAKSAWSQMASKKKQSQGD